jgi:hypothetical protein
MPIRYTGGVSKCPKVCDSATTAAAGAVIDGKHMSTTPAVGLNVNNPDSDVAEASTTPIEDNGARRLRHNLSYRLL